MARGPLDSKQRMNAYYVFVAILGLALLMIVHEWGHFAAARAFGMSVTRFSIGFGPTFFKIVPKDGYYWFTLFADKIRLRLWKHNPEKNGPTIYQVAMIPFLAYVQIAGMNPLEEVDKNDKTSYANASLIARVVTIFSGPFANYAFASVFFFFSFLYGGRYLPNDKLEVNPVAGEPAQIAGFKDGDVVVSVEGTPVKKWDEMAKLISSNPEKPLKIVVDRAGAEVPITVTPKKNEEGEGKIGIAAKPGPHVELGMAESAKLAVTTPPLVVRDLVAGLVELAKRRTAGGFSGPLGITQQMAAAAKESFTEYLRFLGVLSAYLGAFNLLPVPALDGARLLFLGYEAATRRRANARNEALIHALGLAVLFGLMIYVTLNDIHVIGK